VFAVFVGLLSIIDNVLGFVSRLVSFFWKCRDFLGVIPM
jgi:hypothetical protein